VDRESGDSTIRASRAIPVADGRIRGLPGTFQRVEAPQVRYMAMHRTTANPAPGVLSYLAELPASNRIPQTPPSHRRSIAMRPAHQPRLPIPARSLFGDVG
jgi:hypothetical protein